MSGDGLLIDQSARNYFKSVGHDCFGPLVTGFLHWVANKALEADCEQVLFLARDCFLFDKAFDLLYPEFELPTKYLYLSRASTLPARIVESPDVDTLLNNATLKRLTAPSLLIKRYGFRESEWREVAFSLGIDPNEPVNKTQYYENGPYRDLASRILDAYLPSAQVKTELLCQYLKGQGVCGKIAVIDSGWNGSTQSALIALGDRICSDGLTCVGLYLLANDPERHVRPGMNIEGYLYDRNHSSEEFVSAMAAQGLIDFFCGQPCGSTVGYEKDASGDVSPILDEYEFGPESDFSEIAEIMAVLHNGCLDFVRNHLARDTITRAASFAPLQALTSNPGREDVRRIGSLLFMEGDVHPLAKPASVVAYLSNPRRLLNDFSNSTWKLGFLNGLLHNNALCLRLYKNLLRFK